MRAVVEEFFPTFTSGFEGHMTAFYRDVRDLVSIGDGLLADPLALVANLEFEIDGEPCSWSDVAAAWMRVKVAKIDASKGGKANEFAALTRVRATESAIRKLEARKLGQIETTMRRIFPEWDTWPADAQLGCLSMDWAMGANRIQLSYPHFMAACRAQDWNTAAAQCHMSEVGQNDSFRKRNLANVTLFKNAALATDPEVLYYPKDLSA